MGQMKVMRVATAYIISNLLRGRKGLLAGDIFGSSQFNSNSIVEMFTGRRRQQSHYYRRVNRGLFVLLIRTKAGPGKTVKQEEEEISRNHVQTFIVPSVCRFTIKSQGQSITMALPVPVEPESLQLGEDVQRFELFQVQDFGVGQPKLLDEAHVHGYPSVGCVRDLKRK